MNEIQPIFITGAVLFGVCGIITVCMFIYFVWHGHHEVERSSDVQRWHWTNSIWVYASLFTSFFLFTTLYSMNATGIGFMVKPNLHVAHWSRWLFLAAIGFIYNGCLAYILTDTDVNFNRKKAPYMRAQSFFIVFYYVAAQVMIFFGTITSTVNAHIICMIASLVAFFVSILLYFFPHNKLSLVRPDDYMLFSQTSRANEKMKYDVIMTYRGMFLGFIVLCYVFNFIIWFLGRSNDISEVISFKGEMIAYLVSDFVFIVIFSLVFIALTFYFGKMKTVGIKASDGTVSFKSIPLNAFNSRSKPRSV